MAQKSPLGKAREEAHSVAVCTLVCVFLAYVAGTAFLWLAYCTYVPYANALDQGFEWETPLKNITGIEDAIPWPAKMLVRFLGRELENMFELWLLICAILGAVTLIIILSIPSWYGGLQLLKATESLQNPREAMARARRFKIIQKSLCGLEWLGMAYIFVGYFMIPAMRRMPEKLLCGQILMLMTLCTRLQMIRTADIYLSHLRSYINYRKVAAPQGKIVKKGGKSCTLKKIGEKKAELIKKALGQVKIVTAQGK